MCWRCCAKARVIPAHPLALDRARRLDAVRQRALARYYIDAGAGGLAVGVHATQFAIREVGLYEPVLELAARTAREWSERPLVMIAGLSGRTAQACREAEIALRARLPRRHAVAGADERRIDRRAGRALRSGGGRDPAGRLLPADRGRRHRVAGGVLAPLRRDRQRDRDQDGAVQPLSHARCRARRGRRRRRGPRHAVHRQRRPHRARPCSRRSPSSAAATR